MDQRSNKHSILCVQPGQDSWETLGAVLHEHDCVFAKNAYEALREFHRRSFDAYLLEFWLPDWAGPALCREIRGVDPNSSILFCATPIGEEYEKKALRAGADAYLSKPLDPEVLTTKVRELLTESHSLSLRAKRQAELAASEALERRATQAALNQSLERVARSRAYKAFIESGGTRANFDRWWPQLFSSVQATIAA